MRDLTEYARKVDEAASIKEAQDALVNLMDQFQYKDKQRLYKMFAEKRNSKAALQKWAWDLVLVGDGLKVQK